MQEYINTLENDRHYLTRPTSWVSPIDGGQYNTTEWSEAKMLENGFLPLTTMGLETFDSKIQLRGTPVLTKTASTATYTYTPFSKSPQTLRDIAKQDREVAIAALTVTTTAGNTFDADEKSQARMAKKILCLEAQGVGAATSWVLADNSVVVANAAELREALALADAAQDALWVI